MDYKYSSDLSDADFLRVEIFGVAVQVDPLDALGVWEAESGNYTWAHNPNGHASGIFQAMPATLAGLGYRPELGNDGDTRSAAFRAESYQVQLRWAQKYYMPYKGKLKNKAAFYTATFLPADLDLTISGTPDTVLVQKDGRRGWAYTSNSGFDTDKNYIITVGELEDAIDRACRGPRWEEISHRMSAQLQITPQSIPQPIQYDLGTILGIQSALLRLSYNPGPLDGHAGPLTRAAVIAFQHNHGLVSDGIVGPLTRAKLQASLDSLIISG